MTGAKTKALPIALVVAFVISFFLIPLGKLAFDLFALQRSTTSLTELIQDKSSEPVGLNAAFVELAEKTEQVVADSDFPTWKLVSRLLGKSDLLNQVQKRLQELSILAPNATELLGFDGPRKYMLVFQNPAEARGTGGIIGAYAVVTVSRAEFTVERVGSNIDLQHMSEMPIDISSDFFLTYGDDPAIWQNSNMSPHFPYGARVWKALWKNQTGAKLDGVLVVDPFVLKSVLGVTGALKIDDGSVVTPENVVSETLSTAYQRFDGSNLERKNYLVEIAQKTLTLLQAGGYSKIALARALLEPYEEHRILFYSSDPKSQKALEKTLLGGSLDQGGKDYRLVIQNIAGNKMDYYLKRDLKIDVLSCGIKGKTRVVASVANSATELLNLPTYVKGRLDKGRFDGIANSHAVSVFIYGPKGSELLSSKATGFSEDAAFSGYERGRSFYSIPIELSALGSATIEVEFEGGFPQARTTVQPLVEPQATQINNSCR